MSLGDRPRTTGELRGLYDHLYRAPLAPGLPGPYGSHTNRDPWFWVTVRKNLPKGATVLDAGCGRGHLARKLISLGFKVTGTEISQHLIENELTDFPVHNLAYDELGMFFNESFDAVCSNDVLEHLVDEWEVISGLTELSRITRKILLVSVGTKSCNPRYVLSAGLPLIDLHLVLRPQAWWVDLLSKFMKIKVVRRLPAALFCAGEVKR
jgi:2-polyprenyl-3-methyl-5-hydroxy-6-metoxy-1,4-benzoquinol methylase